MARLRRELSAHGVRENGELPDHLTQIMPLLGRMEHDEAADFYAACVAPALARMRAAFQASSNNPFAVILDGICRWLHRQHGAFVAEQPPIPVNLPILQEAFDD